MKRYIKGSMMLLFTFIFLIALIGCSKEKASSDEKATTTETNEAQQSDKEASGKSPSESKNPEKDVNDFVLENTKLVKIFNISKRINEKSPDLGPFFVVRGIDERGQKSEVWIRDMKIYEIINSNQNQGTQDSSDSAKSEK